MPKVRWYHIAVYKLYFWVWQPLLKQRPDLVRMFRDHHDDWLRSQGVDK